MSYSLRKIKTFIDNSSGEYKSNRTICDAYRIAYDDNELGEFAALLDQRTHFGSVWGTVRGPDAALTVLMQEKQSLRITWTESFVPITSNTFERRGYIQFVGEEVVPIVGELINKIRQKKVKESIVIESGKILFRELSLPWSLLVL